jgi:ATP-dependent DNA helicase RecG
MLLDSPIESLPATSGATVLRLKSLGISTYSDLLNYFPFRYENYSLITPIARIQEGEIVTVKGIIIQSKNEISRRGFRLQKITIQDESARLTLTWINQPYLVHLLREGLTMYVAGKVVRFAGKISVQPSEWELAKDETIHTNRIVPVYSEIRGLSSKTVREKIFYIISQLKNTREPPDPLPAEILRYNHIIPLRDAYEGVHFPSSQKNLRDSRRRLSFDELLELHLYSQLVRGEWKKKNVSHPFIIDTEKRLKINSLIGSLPFELTGDQKLSIHEIERDFLQKHPMNRFLQGDVGSGKTVVAAIAAYISYLNKFQTLIMAPTEVLAAQHYETLQKIFKSFQLKVGLRTGSSKSMKKGEEYDIIVGTQALLTSSLTFSNVGLVIIDEQHRFGVIQRSLLKKKGEEPHLLTMTATPIPRTLALTLYGDLDISTLTQMPRGRLPPKTFLVPGSKRADAYAWIRRMVKGERVQVFIICPLIDESEKETLITVKAAKKEFEHLKSKVFNGLHISLLHGKLRAAEKELIMKDFSDGRIDILVSTSVVEVGIDIPNAAIMIIEGAERYGLAQLHQLRGRVGRGKAQSYCCLFSETEDPEKLRRLRFFAGTKNGVKLAEYDLGQRGAGNIFGTRQHGYLRMKIASLTDFELMKQTKDAARFILEKHPHLFPLSTMQRQIEAHKITNN